MALRMMPLTDRLRTALTMPVLVKEMRTRMRGWRTPMLLFITTGITILVALIIIMPEWENYASDMQSMTLAMHTIGTHLFNGLMIMEALLCILFAPALTAGAVSMEREQQTLDLLLLTRLSPMNIVLGKLISSLSFILVIMLCVMPIAALSFMLGGVDPGQFGWSMLVILSTVALYGCIGVFASSRFPKTATSVVLTYGLAIAWPAIIPACVGMLSLIGGFRGLGSLPSSYLLVAAVIAMVLAVAPATCCSVSASLIIRRPMSRISNIIFYCVCFAVLFTPLATMPHEVFSLLRGHTIDFLVGNPVCGFITAVWGPEVFFGASPSSWLAKWFVPLTIIIQCVAAWIFLVLTSGQLKKLRD